MRDINPYYSSSAIKIILMVFVSLSVSSVQDELRVRADLSRGAPSVLANTMARAKLNATVNISSQNTG
jgi:hypothetical protein